MNWKLKNVSLKRSFARIYTLIINITTVSGNMITVVPTTENKLNHIYIYIRHYAPIKPQNNIPQ